MDERQKNANKRYTEIVNSTTNMATTVGRPENTLELTKYICDDIEKKLGLEKGDRLLDIGCGYGDLTKHILSLSSELSLELSLLDIEAIINKIKNNLLELFPSNIDFITGTFPGCIDAKDKFDKILIYSVLHYTDKPEDIVQTAVELLAPGGKLLIGDIPNVNRKGRFVATEFGRAFDAEYHKKDINDIPVYKDQYEYVEKCTNQNTRICDDLISTIFTQYRKKGFDVFVLPQDKCLPFSLTREDILIKAPNI